MNIWVVVMHELLEKNQRILVHLCISSKMITELIVYIVDKQRAKCWRLLSIGKNVTK